MAKKNETSKQAQAPRGRAQTYKIGQVAVDAGAIPAEGHTLAQDPNPIGTVMRDGTVYGGVSPTTKAPMYVAQLEIDDSDIRRDFRDAQNFARDLEISGNRDFHVPDEAEMKVLYENRNKGVLSKIFNQINPTYEGNFDPTGDKWGEEKNSKLPDFLKADTSTYRGQEDQCVYWTSKSCGFIGAKALDFSTGKPTKDSRGNLYATVCIR